MKAPYTRTSATTPRAVSTFQTTETRETYRMAEELRFLLNLKPNKFSTVEELINEGHRRGYCRPFEDYARISHTHPYGRILTDMANPESPLYTPTLEVADWMRGPMNFRVRTDIIRSRSGRWRKVKGQELIDYIPA